MPVRESHTRLNLFDDNEATQSGYGSVHLDRDGFVALLNELHAADDIAILRTKTTELKRTIASSDSALSTDMRSNGNIASLRRDVLTSELDQILDARTPERARYYLKRLERGVKKVKTSAINDVNLH